MFLYQQVGNAFANVFTKYQSSKLKMTIKVVIFMQYLFLCLGYIIFMVMLGLMAIIVSENSDRIYTLNNTRTDSCNVHYSGLMMTLSNVKMIALQPFIFLGHAQLSLDPLQPVVRLYLWAHNEDRITSSCGTKNRLRN